jgi:hypothetical protein
MAKFPRIDSIRLIGGHSLILGYKPDKLSLSQVNKVAIDHPQDFGQFGLFDSSTPNYTTYYPDVTAEDLKPQDDEFIYPVFRMLSNVTVHPGHNPIYFNEDVLKKNMYKLIGQTVNVDHETAVGNAIGTVQSVEWQDAYTTKDGIKVPSGINAVLKIDGKSNPRLARAIMMDPPAIHSNSVTVTFAWEKSHPTMTDADFWDQLGTKAKDGKIVQRMVTHIQAFHETSLVSHGADYFAQIIGKDGKIVNPSYAASKYPFSEQTPDDKKSAKTFSYDYKEELSSVSLNDITIPEETNNNNNTGTTMKEYLAVLAALLGFTAEELTEENYRDKVKSQIASLKDANKPQPLVIGSLTGVEAVTAELTRLQGIENTYNQGKDQIDLAATVTTELRQDTLRLYRLSLGEKGTEDAQLTGVIEKADYATLKALNKQYNDLTEGQFQLTCSSCGSHEVTRASTKPAGSDDAPTIKSTDEAVAAIIAKNKINTKHITG